MEVQTDHQIVSFGADRMMLFDAHAGAVIVDCHRGPDGYWTAAADGVPDVTVPADPQPNTNGVDRMPTHRQGAITAMIAQAKASLGTNTALDTETYGHDPGYSTVVPHGLPETP